jgi:hypothetical protein
MPSTRKTLHDYGRSPRTYSRKYRDGETQIATSFFSAAGMFAEKLAAFKKTFVS